MKIRAAAFIDGFNLYHAVDDSRQSQFKWLDLCALIEVFVPASQFDLVAVYYFSAYATWRANAYKRHREYVKALQANGVTPVMGQFKKKSRTCFSCGAKWETHEEKETDVNIALYMLDGAYRDEYDRALLVSADSDLAPAVQMVKSRFPNKSVKILTPIGRHHSMRLVRAAGGLKMAKKIEYVHMEHCIFAEEICDKAGNVIAKRPAGYGKPQNVGT
jgi:uncharacterized LabA/DUF88 family protein